MISDRWMVKSVSNTPTVESAREEFHYVETNPHADWLGQVFEVAGVDYGRIDYGVLNGRPQAWEINLNPTLGARLGHGREPRPPEVEAIQNRTREISHGRLRAAFSALDTDDRGEPVVVRLNRELLASARAELAARRRSRRIVDALSRFTHSAWVEAPFRAALKNFTPR
jgi:hypothetical protein